MRNGAVLTSPVLRFDVNLSILFTELPLLERFAAARSAGLDAVELWWPLPEAVPLQRELDTVRHAIEDAGVRLVGLNFAAGDMAAGERGLLSRPADVHLFRENVHVAVEFAGQLGCRTLNALYGNREPGLWPQEQDELAVANLTYAAQAADRIGATVVVEALNSHENPVYPIISLASAYHVLELVRANGPRNVAFLADLYHLSRMGEDLDTQIDRRAAEFGHVQIADVPGRGQPGTGGIDYEKVLARLLLAGYQGHIGLEYRPVGFSADSFGWLPKLRAAVESTVEGSA